MKLLPLLFSPFQRVAGAASLALGLAAIVVAALIGAGKGLHFDGVLDVHAGRLAPGWFFVAEGLIDWLCLSLVLLLAGRVVSRTAFRSIDLLGTQALARWPMVLVALACLAPGFHRFSAALIKSLSNLKPGAVPALPGGPDAAVFATVTVVILACIVWMVALMWKSFSHCCNVRGGKAAAAFVIGLLIAEALSKVLIGQLFLLK
ncbi:MAG: hypothetical protein IAE77_00165 [Prosthecobacter sp.]|uniref:hypothetical protein n=1 Tax=Prosthecobacter sp. TaxID=1965333 RepID=UPI001A0AF5C3|nr:hypothetical protein [Prosthecobacter sp.]MBE2281853.1 hypothetical protein [Prosthecobacter sp.]